MRSWKLNLMVNEQCFKRFLSRLLGMKSKELRQKTLILSHSRQDKI